MPTYEQQQKYGIKTGAVVVSVSDDTPASRAGFQVEDVIVRYNGKEVESDSALRDMISRTAPGSLADVEIKRHGREQTLHVTIGTAPSLDAPKSRPVSTEAPAAERGKLGVSVGDASDAKVREALGLKGPVTGAVIAQVVPGSPAQEAGLRAGDIITRLDEKPINNAADLSSTARNLRSGSSVNAVIRRQGASMLVQISLE
jgi:serine protease Do